MGPRGWGEGVPPMASAAANRFLEATARWPRLSFSSSASGSTGGESPEVAREERMTLPGKVCWGSTGIGRPAETYKAGVRQIRARAERH